MGIYVETHIRCDLEDAWRATQDPAAHQRWDLRFTTIEYLRRPNADDVQRFLYVTRIGGGIRISGEGESTGTHEQDGTRTSALKFWSKDPKSLIRIGSGYWRYVPSTGGTRFLTWYDYQVRFGLLGRILDRLLFRPIIGTATAWSFDRLRLWLEEGREPEASRRLSFAYWLCRATVAFIWFYEGLVPKLLFHDPAEIQMNMSLGFGPIGARHFSDFAGAAEILLGLAVLGTRWRWPYFLTLLLMLIKLVFVCVFVPQYFQGAFNPATLNVAMASLAAGALLLEPCAPAAARCLRTPPNGPGS